MAHEIHRAQAFTNFLDGQNRKEQERSNSANVGFKVTLGSHDALEAWSLGPGGFERAPAGPFLCLARKKLGATTMENGDPGFTTAMHKRHWSNSPPTTTFPVQSGRALALRPAGAFCAPSRCATTAVGVSVFETYLGHSLSSDVSADTNSAPSWSSSTTS
jgi:hypothetical protein